jgi:hypothetical protein
MKVLITSLVFLFLLIAFSGCYTVPQYFAENNECEEVIVYTEVVLPPPPIIYYPPVPDPNPRPIIRQPEIPLETKGYKDQVRDPLRGHGERGNEKRNTQGRK